MSIHAQNQRPMNCTETPELQQFAMQKGENEKGNEHTSVVLNAEHFSFNSVLE